MQRTKLLCGLLAVAVVAGGARLAEAGQWGVAYGGPVYVAPAPVVVHPAPVVVQPYYHAPPVVAAPVVVPAPAYVAPSVVHPRVRTKVRVGPFGRVRVRSRAF